MRLPGSAALLPLSSLHSAEPWACRSFSVRSSWSLRRLKHKGDCRARLDSERASAGSSVPREAKWSRGGDHEPILLLAGAEEPGLLPAWVPSQACLSPALTPCCRRKLSWKSLLEGSLQQPSCPGLLYPGLCRHLGAEKTGQELQCHRLGFSSVHPPLPSLSPEELRRWLCVICSRQGRCWLQVG